MGLRDINAGLVPGLFGDLAALHGRNYAEHYGFPVLFEDKVAREMGEYLSRYDAAKDHVYGLGTATASLTRLPSVAATLSSPSVRRICAGSFCTTAWHGRDWAVG